MIFFSLVLKVTAVEKHRVAESGNTVNFSTNVGVVATKRTALLKRRWTQRNIVKLIERLLTSCGPFNRFLLKEAGKVSQKKWALLALGKKNWRWTVWSKEEFTTWNQLSQIEARWKKLEGTTTNKPFCLRKRDRNLKDIFKSADLCQHSQTSQINRTFAQKPSAPLFSCFYNSNFFHSYTNVWMALILPRQEHISRVAGLTVAKWRFTAVIGTRSHGADGTPGARDQGPAASAWRHAFECQPSRFADICSTTSKAVCLIEPCRHNQTNI